MAYEKTIVIGLGNPILGDDGVGWKIAECIRQEVRDPSIEVICLSRGGIYLMEQLVGYDNSIIIDAILAKDEIPGSVSQFPLEALPDPTAGHTFSIHDTSLLIALKIGRLAGFHLPESIHAVVVATQNVNTFTEELTPAVEAAIPRATQMVRDLLDLTLKEIESTEKSECITNATIPEASDVP